jgi:hypothetical protein
MTGREAGDSRKEEVVAEAMNRPTGEAAPIPAGLAAIAEGLDPLDRGDGVPLG